MPRNSPPVATGAPVALGLFLAACSAPSDPSGTRPGACYGEDLSPAVIEVVSEQELLEPAQFAPDGSLLKPALYRTTTRQQIVTPRRELVFEVPCPEMFTPDFIASLQRALAARGLYRDTPSGEMDTATRQAIRAYQSAAGLDSDLLSMESALRLGLIAYGREPGSL